MANNDMHIIIYKLLAYLYDCLKRGKEPDRAMFERDGAIFCGVPDKYRCMIIRQIVKHEYVIGLKVIETDGIYEVVPVNPELTLEGYEYMRENELMKRALESLRAAKSSLPFL